MLINHSPIAVNDTIIICENGGTITKAVQSNDSDPDGNTLTTSIYTGPKNGTASLSGNAINYTPNANYTGNDTIRYVICDNGIPSLCDTALVLIIVNPLPSANPGPRQTICYGDTISIGTPAIPGNTYAWTPNRGLSSYNVAEPSASPADTTTYILIVTNSLTGCQAVDSTTIIVKPKPTAHILQGDSVGFCPADSALLFSSSGASFLWSNGDTTKSIYVSGIGDYSVAITYANGCTDYSAPTTVIKNLLPIANAGPDKVICWRESTKIGTPSSAHNTYSWLPATGLDSTNIAQPLATAGAAVTITYILTVTDTLTGCHNVDSVSVTVSPSPAADAGTNQTICAGNSTVIGAASVSGNTYNWSPVTGLNSSSIAQPTARPDTTTIYVLTETITATGCQKTDSVTVTVNPAPVVDAGTNQLICEGSHVLIGATSVPGNTYNWLPITGLNSGTISQPIASPDSTTIYTLTETITSTGCQGTGFVTVTVNPSPAANTGPNQTICTGGSATIGSAPIVGNTYSWSPSIGLSSNSVSQPVATPANTVTTYTLTETVTGSGCQKTNSVTITTTPPPAANAGANQTICNGSSTTIGATAVSGNTYTWSPGTGLSSTTVSQPTANPTATTTYTLTETSPGCSISNTVTITVNPSPAANTGSDQTIVNGTSVTLGEPSVSGNTYSWSPDTDLSSASISDPIASPVTTTTYSLIETNSSTGCSKTNSVTVTVNPNEGSVSTEFFNGFSPNGDGVNDKWDIPLLTNYPDNQVLILNRWGDEVWLGINYDSKNVVWSGQNMKGENLPDGTYYYTISYNQQDKQGWVFIKR